jgi:plastocyanin
VPPPGQTRRRLLAAATGSIALVAGCSQPAEESDPTDDAATTAAETTARTAASTATTTTSTGDATFDIEATVESSSVSVGGRISVAVTVTNSGDAAGDTILRLARDGESADSAFVDLAPGETGTVELVATAPMEPGSVALAVNGDPIGDVTVDSPEALHVAPDGADDAAGTADDPLRTIDTALAYADPGATIELAPGEYRESIRTKRAGEPDAPITITGPADAVVRPPPGYHRAVHIVHSHVHIRGFTINGLAEPDNRFSYHQAWTPLCVVVSPVHRRDEGVDYLEDVVVEPARIGNSGRALVQIERVRDVVVGGFEVNGPAGMQYDPRVDNHDVGHIREIVYVGSPEVHRGEDHYGYETLDRTRNVRIHHIDNSAGYEHNELVDVKLGSEDVTVEYCTDRNAGHNTEGLVNAAIDLKGNDCTVRYNDVGECPLPMSFGAWAPSEDVDGGDWSQNNAVYGNHVHDFAAGPFRLRNEGDIGPVTFEDQRVLCGNRIERGSLDLDPWLVDPNGFDGVVDARGQGDVTVSVGASPNGRALDPAVVLVDRGTTVTWDWVADSGEHYVVERQRLENDPDTVPDPRAAPYSESTTFDLIGMTRHACYAHHDAGMHGAVVVADDRDRWDFTTADCDADLPDGDGVGHTGGDSPWA